MTKQEKAVIYFLIAMMALGLGVKFYRARAGRIKLKVESSSLERIVREKQTVSINKATAADFARLAGIGPHLAEDIVEYRTQNGDFTTTDDIMKVKGIGAKKYEKIKDYLEVE